MLGRFYLFSVLWVWYLFCCCSLVLRENRFSFISIFKDYYLSKFSIASWYSYSNLYLLLNFPILHSFSSRLIKSCSRYAFIIILFICITTTHEYSYYSFFFLFDFLIISLWSIIVVRDYIFQLIFPKINFLFLFYISFSILINFISLLFVSGGQRNGASASASVLPMNIQGWFPLGLTDLTSLQSKGLSRVVSSITI